MFSDLGDKRKNVKKNRKKVETIRCFKAEKVKKKLEKNWEKVRRQVRKKSWGKKPGKSKKKMLFKGSIPLKKNGIL